MTVGGRMWARRVVVGAMAGVAAGVVPLVAAGAQATPIIVTITSSAQFDVEVLKRSEERLMVVFFTTTWCSKCKKVDPSVRDMAQKADGRWGLAVVDADRNEALANKYNVAALPTFLFMCQREVHGRLVDEGSPVVLQERISKEESWCSRAVLPIGQAEEPVPAPKPEGTVTPGPTTPQVEPGSGTDPVPVEPWWIG